MGFFKRPRPVRNVFPKLGFVLMPHLEMYRILMYEGRGEDLTNLLSLTKYKGHDAYSGDSVTLI